MHGYNKDKLKNSNVLYCYVPSVRNRRKKAREVTTTKAAHCHEIFWVIFFSSLFSSGCRICLSASVCICKRDSNARENLRDKTDCWTTTDTEMTIDLIFFVVAVFSHRVCEFDYGIKWRKKMWKRNILMLSTVSFSYFQMMMCDGICMAEAENSNAEFIKMNLSSFRVWQEPADISIDNEMQKHEKRLDLLFCAMPENVFEWGNTALVYITWIFEALGASQCGVLHFQICLWTKIYAK